MDSVLWTLGRGLGRALFSAAVRRAVWRVRGGWLALALTALAGALLMVAVVPVHAAGTVLRSQALATCNASIPAAHARIPSLSFFCKDFPGSGTSGSWHRGYICPAGGYCQAGVFINDDSASYSYNYDIGDPPFSCNSLPTVAHNFPGRLFNGYNFPQSATDPATGATTQCTMVLSGCTPPTYDAVHTQWMTFCTAGPSGGTSGGAGWNDGVGPTAGIPGPPTTPLAPEPPPPKICDGVSCYDPGTDKYCAGVAGGGQVCVPGSSGRGGPGGCASSGDSTICAGPQQAPTPPPSQVPDPPSQISGAGETTHATPPTPGSGGQGGGVVIVHTTTYGQPGSSANNGAGSGDSAPAPPSSSGGTGSFGGGGSCDTPPACTGDAVLCGIARTQWATTCQVHKDLAGTAPAPSLSSLGAGLSASKVWVDAPAGTTVGDAANAGSYDTSGGGASRVCPLTDFHFSTVSVTVPLSKGCDPLWWLGLAGEGFALFGAARITAGSNT